MDPAAIAELTVEMYSLIDAKLIARKYSMLDPEIKAMMLKEAMALYITNVIKETRSVAPGGTPQQEGRPATEKQIAFIKDLGGDPNTVHSSVEASKLIEELKK